MSEEVFDKQTTNFIKYEQECLLTPRYIWVYRLWIQKWLWNVFYSCQHLITKYHVLRLVATPYVLSCSDSSGIPVKRAINIRNVLCEIGSLHQLFNVKLLSKSDGGSSNHLPNECWSRRSFKQSKARCRQCLAETCSNNEQNRRSSIRLICWESIIWGPFKSYIS